MQSSQRTTILVFLGGVIVLGILILGLSHLIPTPHTPEVIVPTETPAATTSTPYTDTATIGTSVEGRPIEAYRFGTGGTTLLFVGGIHGGYEWNSSLLAYQAIDYLTLNESLVPDELTVYIIPDLNPDGTSQVTGTTGRFTLANIPNPEERVAAARFNSNGIDLNRNFDCRWQPTSTWRGEVVSAGTNAFSEPEAAALQNFVTTHNPTAVVFWHSKADAVYGAECGDGIASSTLNLLNTYATAAGYTAIPTFDAYPVSGDAEGWLTSIGIPAITVELGTSNTTEWEQNRLGLTTLLQSYAK